MANNRTTVIFQNGEELEIEKGTTLYELSKIYQPKMKLSIVGAEINNEVVPLDTQINRSTKVTFLDSNTFNGYKINKVGLEFVTEKALKEEFNGEYEVTFDHSIANGIHMTIIGEKKFNLSDAKKLKAKMNEIIEADDKIYSLNVKKKEAIAYYNKVKASEKANNIHNVTNNIVSIYKLRNSLNYFYAEMPYSTGCLTSYDLVFLGDNKLVLLFPSPKTKYKVPEYIHYQNVIKCFEESKKWIESIEAKYLSDVNKYVSDCKIDNIIYN